METTVEASIAPSENVVLTGNQQGSLSSEDLAWIAGLWDGDGWIGITKAKRSKTKKSRYSASVMLVTTSDRLAGRVIDILTRMGCPPTMQYKRGAYQGTDGSWRRPKWNIVLRSNVATQRFLTAISPHLTEKAVCAELVLGYVRWREQQPKQLPDGTTFKLVQDKAETVIALLSEDRKRHDPPETVRLDALTA